jgi:transcriptional regulator of nitric oxide reductase
VPDPDLIKRLFAPIYRHVLRASVWLALWAWVSVAAFNTACADPVYQLTQKYFPQTDRVGVFEGEPLAASVYAGERLLGYVFRTTDIAPIPAYSGKPITLLVGIGVDGRISGLEITQHSEPVLAAGVSEKDLKRYVDQYQGVSVRERVKPGGAQREGYVTIDGITGATITAMVMNATVMKAIRKVAESRGRQRSAPCRLKCRQTGRPPRPGGWARQVSPSGCLCGGVH